MWVMKGTIEAKNGARVHGELQEELLQEQHFSGSSSSSSSGRDPPESLRQVGILLHKLERIETLLGNLPFFFPSNVFYSLPPSPSLQNLKLPNGIDGHNASTIIESEVEGNFFNSFRYCRSDRPKNPKEMLHGGNPLKGHCLYCLFTSLFVGILLQLPQAASIVAPSSNCYVLDNSSYLFDFTSWIGRPFEYVGKGAESPDLMIRFCKDVESRSRAGYVDFGRFATSNHFVAGSGNVNFIQGFYKGDLLNCEHSFDKLGRTAQVNLICGNCINGLCKGDLGCICNVTYEEARCRVLVELAIPCEKKGSRVFEGFTVGFHPRSWEIVYNGMTQLGFEKPHTRFSFETEQTSVSLYLTAISSLSGLVGKPFYKVIPENGLEVKFTGSGANGHPPTTLSPTTLVVNWRCEKAHNTPYEVTISIPVKGYEPIKFTLTKMCEYSQDKGSDATRGWATFGVFSCIFIVIATLFCCGGFIYKARVEHQHGLDALPGMTILSACLETVSGPSGYSQLENPDSAFTNQASWERMPVSAQGSQRTSQRKYGTT